MDALAIGSVTKSQASPKSMTLVGDAYSMSNSVFMPSAASHCKQEENVRQEEIARITEWVRTVGVLQNWKARTSRQRILGTKGWIFIHADVVLNWRRGITGEKANS